jgi:integrase
MQLIDYLELYLTERDVSAVYRRDLKYSLTYLDNWYGRSVMVDELADELINRWLVFLATNMSPRSVKHHRTNLLALWRAAHEAGLTDRLPQRVRRIKVPPQPPRAWALSEMSKLLDETDKLPGVFMGTELSWSAFLRAYILVAWDTGLRPSDMVLICFSQVTEAGVLAHIQHKTSQPIICQLKPETVEALRKIAAPKRERIFGDLACRDWCYRLFTRLVKRAGLTGSPKKLRKSAATCVEAAGLNAGIDGAATKFLGHLTQDLARVHYIDPTQVTPKRPHTPPIAQPKSLDDPSS